MTSDGVFLNSMSSRRSTCPPAYNLDPSLIHPPPCVIKDLLEQDKGAEQARRHLGARFLASLHTVGFQFGDLVEREGAGPGDLGTDAGKLGVGKGLYSKQTHPLAPSPYLSFVVGWDRDNRASLLSRLSPSCLASLTTTFGEERSGYGHVLGYRGRSAFPLKKLDRESKRGATRLFHAQKL